jgi:hypothetical protein
MKPHEPNQKKGKQRMIKNQIKKDNKTLSKRNEKGQGKKFDKRQ